ncbi:uncharacterized protein MYCFIDRAFT_176328 [Pseudocercospora fijiensis CIRAD86]|uniref:Uncharacterized protein n=1 Tax=Pseudocercospora fijiensis (strain CIRAD86) TaxID=383855 RepID=M3A8M8_PSEFD|nr:uncharacterized protein MYCFIDRAFT_176328 [Pseudocercospora fijiensis CIRAD86]EME80981.1 hypothetical protein MYCFIDRAFT_176328 [Pseudocercospora fijiensis CIRAD86]
MTRHAGLLDRHSLLSLLDLGVSVSVSVSSHVRFFSLLCITRFFVVVTVLTLNATDSFFKTSTCHVFRQGLIAKQSTFLGEIFARTIANEHRPAYRKRFCYLIASVRNTTCQGAPSITDIQGSSAAIAPTHVLAIFKWPSTTDQLDLVAFSYRASVGVPALQASSKQTPDHKLPTSNPMSLFVGMSLTVMPMSVHVIANSQAPPERSKTGNVRQDNASVTEFPGNWIQKGAKDHVIEWLCGSSETSQSGAWKLRVRLLHTYYTLSAHHCNQQVHDMSVHTVKETIVALTGSSKSEKSSSKRLMKQPCIVNKPKRAYERFTNDTFCCQIQFLKSGTYILGEIGVVRSGSGYCGLQDILRNQRTRNLPVPISHLCSIRRVAPLCDVDQPKPAIVAILRLPSMLLVIVGVIEAFVRLPLQNHHGCFLQLSLLQGNLFPKHIARQRCLYSLSLWVWATQSSRLGLSKPCELAKDESSVQDGLLSEEVRGRHNVQLSSELATPCSDATLIYLSGLFRRRRMAALEISSPAPGEPWETALLEVSNDRTICRNPVTTSTSNPEKTSLRGFALERPACIQHRPVSPTRLRAEPTRLLHTQGCLTAAKTKRTLLEDWNDRSEASAPAKKRDLAHLANSLLRTQDKLTVTRARCQLMIISHDALLHQQQLTSGDRNTHAKATPRPRQVLQHRTATTCCIDMGRSECLECLAKHGGAQLMHSTNHEIPCPQGLMPPNHFNGKSAFNEQAGAKHYSANKRLLECIRLPVQLMPMPMCMQDVLLNLNVAYSLKYKCITSQPSSFHLFRHVQKFNIFRDTTDLDPNHSRRKGNVVADAQVYPHGLVYHLRSLFAFSKLNTEYCISYFFLVRLNVCKAIITTEPEQQAEMSCPPTDSQKPLVLTGKGGGKKACINNTGHTFRCRGAVPAPGGFLKTNPSRKKKSGALRFWSCFVGTVQHSASFSYANQDL